MSAPLIFAGIGLGFRLTHDHGYHNFSRHHQRVGFALLILYIVQLILGNLVHFVKSDKMFKVAGRAVHNYVHAVIGLTIMAMACYQVHLGFYVEWPYAVSTVVQLPAGAKRSWLALTILMFSLYAIGLAFLPRQLKQEKQHRKNLEQKDKEAAIEK
ncbi:hypothetical protein AX17_007512 [Amanita inopinata Kibby_2008]|nr:hypothetical protein AX17_007512 [Amanita inopinata Kibby_2008]